MRVLTAVGLVVIGLSWACAEKSDLRDVRITEANRATVLERVERDAELTGEEVRLLDAYLERKGLGELLPLGVTIGEILAEQKGFEGRGGPAPAEPVEPAVEAHAEMGEVEEAPRAPAPSAVPAIPAPHAPSSASPVPAPPAPPEVPAPPAPVAAPAPPTPVPPAPEAPPRRVRAPRFETLPAGTTIEVYLDEPLGSKTSASGDRFAAVLGRDLSVDGRVLAPRGSHLAGRVVEARPAGKVKGLARLSLTLEELELGDRSHTLETNPIVVEAQPSKGEDAKKVGIGAGAGAVIGAIIGGKKGAAIGGAVGAATGGAVVLATSGDEVELPAEQALAFELLAGLELPVAED
jgi:hypothetical protein